MQATFASLRGYAARNAKDGYGKNRVRSNIARRLMQTLGFIYSRKKDKDSRLEFAFLFAMC
jgi:hypothetical protein